MDLVDEEDVALLEVGQQGGQVARPGQHRPRGDPEPDAHLGGHDAGQRGLARARAGRRRGGGRPAGARRRAACSTMPRCSTSWGWPDELGQRARPQARPLRPPRPAPPRGRRRARRRRPRAPLVRAPRGGPRGSPGGQLPQRQPQQLLDPEVLAHALEGRRGSRRARSRARPGRPGPRPGPSRRPRRPAASPERSGRSRRLFRSMSSRAAVLRPTPGTAHRVSTSSSSTAVDKAAGERDDRMARARAGPTPWAPSRASKHRRSSSWAKP